jgi:serine/threonine protein kinase
MVSRSLTCNCGHRWVHEDAAPVPDDVSEICPICSVQGDATRTRVRAERADSSKGENGNDVPMATKPLDESTEYVPPRPEGAKTSEFGLKPGTVLGGFEVLEELNRGGMGVIYKARQRGLNRLVALKVIAPDQFRHADTRKRFEREVQAAALLSHPNIVTVFHTDLDAPAPYLAMEFVDGVDLSRLVGYTGALPVLDACFYIEQAAHGLQHAHEKGLVHRDIKPSNLMVTPSPLRGPGRINVRRGPRVKILDMGLARVTNAAAAPALHHFTRLGEYLGTPDYMSPEQAEDPRLVDTRSDLYSLGSTLYFLLTGDVPFPGKSLTRKIKQQRSELPPSPRDRRPDTPASVAEIVTRLLAQEPADRFQTPLDLIDALAPVLRELERLAVVPHISSPAVRAVVSTELPPAPAPSTHHPVMFVPAHPGGVRSLSISPDGTFLLSGGADETLRLWETAGMREQAVLATGVGPVACVRISPNGRRAASCSAPRPSPANRVVQFWHLGSRRERRRLIGHSGDVYCLAISPDGRRVAAGSDNAVVLLWNLDEPEAPPVALRGHTGAVRGLAYSAGGALVISGSQDGTVRLWDAMTGARKGKLRARVGPVWDVAFSVTAKRLAIAGAAGLRLRQADSSMLVLTGHRGDVQCTAFSADGRFLASGGADGTVRLWQAEDSQELAVWEGHTGVVHAVVFAPDGRGVYSGGADGTLRLWSMSG